MAYAYEDFQDRATAADQKIKDLLTKLQAYEKSESASGSLAVGSPVEVYYWPIGHKGMLIRRLLSVAGVDYTWIRDGGAIKQVTRAFGSAGEKNSDFPAKAPPLIKVGSKFIGQTQVICNFICQTNPTLLPKDSFDQFHTQQVISNVIDIIDEMTIGKSGKITDDEEYNNLYFSEESRLQQWFSLLNDSIGCTPTHYHFEGRLTAADYAVHWLMDGLRQLFNFDGKDRFTAMALPKYDNLKALLSELDASDNYKNSLKELSDAGCEWWPTSDKYAAGKERFMKMVVAFEAASA